MSTRIELTAGVSSAHVNQASPLEVAAAPDAPLVTTIVPPRAWEPLNLGELWKSRELLYFLVWRDVKVRYKQTLLGALWAVLQPALMMVVFTVFFGRMAKVSSGDLPYALFAYFGLVPWTFFATSISNAGNSVVGSERLITKIYFPRLAIPFASVGAALVDFAIAFSLLVVLMVCYGVSPGMKIMLLPVVLLPILLTALGVGTWLAALNVAYRDFRYVIPFLTQLWMFATPSVYMDTHASSGPLRAVLALNPMTGLISAFRTVCRGGNLEWGPWGLSVAFAIVVFLLGCFFFRRMERNFADII